MPSRTEFTAHSTLDARWQTLRVPADPFWLSFTGRTGWLRMSGRESPHSLHDQSFLARRLEGFRAIVTTRMEFLPTRFTQFAGLFCWYETRIYYALNVTHDERLGRDRPRAA